MSKELLIKNFYVVTVDPAPTCPGATPWWRTASSLLSAPPGVRDDSR